MMCNFKNTKGYWRALKSTKTKKLVGDIEKLIALNPSITITLTTQQYDMLTDFLSFLEKNQAKTQMYFDKALIKRGLYAI